MGFFDALNDPEQSSRLAAALKIMELSGPSRTPTNLGQILAGGLGSYLNTKQDHQDRAAQQEQLKQMQAMRALQMRKLQGDFDAEQAQQAQAAQLGNAYKDFYSQGQHISNPMAAITGPTLDQLPKLEQVNQEPKRPLSPFDREMKLAEFLRGQGMFMDAIKHEKQAHEVRGKGEWKNVIKDGKVLSAPFFQDGTRGDISDLAPAYDKQIKDFGGFFGVMDPILGGVLEKYAKTQSADSKASNALGWARLNYEKSKSTGDRQKPMPSSALKMQQTELDALGTAGGIQSELGRIQTQIKTGKLDFGLISNLSNQARNFVGMSNEESRNFASFKATMERLRNESLRLNAGVQTDGDAQRAWNELFANINDRGVVEQRLQEIQNINARAIKLRKMNVDGIRANYGKDPLELNDYETPAAPASNGWSIERVK
jgi:hypothetical protein